MRRLAQKPAGRARFLRWNADGVVAHRRISVPRALRSARTRARFDCPRSVVRVADVDEELVAQLTAWLALGGRRIGLEFWRPEKSGLHGRFDVKDVTPV